jgi:hypothetical protein
MYEACKKDSIGCNPTVAREISPKVEDKQNAAIMQKIAQDDKLLIVPFQPGNESVGISLSF